MSKMGDTTPRATTPTDEASQIQPVPTMDVAIGYRNRWLQSINNTYAGVKNTRLWADARAFVLDQTEIVEQERDHYTNSRSSVVLGDLMGIRIEQRWTRLVVFYNEDDNMNATDENPWYEAPRLGGVPDGPQQDALPALIMSLLHARVLNRKVKGSIS